VSEVRIVAEIRTEFGKGGARRTRREHKIPAVLYGHGLEPKHLSLAGHELTQALRKGGLNTLLTISVDGEDQIALPKALQVHPLKRIIQHVDLIAVRSGEKVTVDIPLVVVGEAQPGSLVNQDLTSLSVEAEATHIPESIELSIEGLRIGTQVNASDVKLPSGSTLVTDPEALVIAINAAPTDEQIEAELEAAEEELGAGAAGSDDQPAAEDAEGDSDSDSDADKTEE
jgi:large subunit ribosomal protein L25